MINILRVVILVQLACLFCASTDEEPVMPRYPKSYFTFINNGQESSSNLEYMKYFYTHFDAFCLCVVVVQFCVVAEV